MGHLHCHTDMTRPPAGTFDVIVVGAGPTGLTLALDLGRRGVKCLLVEKEASTKPYPRADRLNARTMECYRALGIADHVRSLGFPPDVPMNVYVVTRLCDQPLAVLECPSVGEYRALIAESNDGSLPLEPYQLVAQNDLEALLREKAEAMPNVSLRFGCEFVRLQQDEAGVTATLLSRYGGEALVRARYLIGADGAHSTVRKSLGIEMAGHGELEQVQTQVIFQSDDLFEAIPIGKGRHYFFVDEYGSRLVVQGNRREFIFHTRLPPESDFSRLVREYAGIDFDLRIKHVFTWHRRVLIAERFRQGRAFLAGDAAHLVSPTGGLGANGGIGDALNISWKLAGAVGGWAGPALLDSYERERRPVAEQNCQASAWAFEGMARWRAHVKAFLSASSPRDRERLRGAVAESARHDLGRYCGVIEDRLGGKFAGSFLGAELGYTYAGSPVIAGEFPGVAKWDHLRYTPTTMPGARLPHMWLSDGRALQDVIDGAGYTVLDLHGNYDMTELVAAFQSLTAPVSVLRLDEPHLREVYGCSLLLLRPDLHIVWRGNAQPPDPLTLAALAIGNLDEGPKNSSDLAA